MAGRGGVEGVVGCEEGGEGGGKGGGEDEEDVS